MGFTAPVELAQAGQAPRPQTYPHTRYGSPYSPDSINNPYGKYGSRYSPQGVKNPYGTGEW